jgi:hypothetical protein
MAVRYLVPDGKHLPVSGEDGKPNHHLMGAAWAALHGGYRGNKYEGPGKQEALEKLKSLYRSEGMELPDTEGSEHQMANINDTPEERAAMRKLLGDSEISHERIRELIDGQLEKYFPEPGPSQPGPMARVSEVYPSYAIVEYDGKQYRIAYETKGDAVKTEKPEEVKTKFVPASELETARAMLMGEVNAYAKDHRCPAGVALSEVTRLRPYLWERYSKALMRRI